MPLESYLWLDRCLQNHTFGLIGASRIIPFNISSAHLDHFLIILINECFRKVSICQGTIPLAYQLKYEYKSPAALIDLGVSPLSKTALFPLIMRSLDVGVTGFSTAVASTWPDSKLSSATCRPSSGASVSQFIN